MKTKPLMLSIVSAAVFFCGPAASLVSAQLADPPDASVYQPLSDQQLDQLLGPIALYPDPLLGEILPAATLPAQIVLADRYVAGGGDPFLIAQQGWDASVVALTYYPAVLKYLDDNLAWTTAVGEAFLYQQDQVLESIQRLRLSAQNFGNLVSTPQQQVVNDNGDIEILPASPDVIYVPVYEPYYVYEDSGISLAFESACATGPWLNCDFDWVHHTLRHWGHDHHRPADWWHETPAQRLATLATQTTVWHPANHRGLTAGGRINGSRNNPPSPAYQGQNNTVVNMSRPGLGPRPAATPMPAASPMPAAQPRPFVGRSSGAFQIPTQPAPAVNPAANRPFAGSENGQEPRNFNERSPGNVSTFHEPPPVQSEPAHVEPVHTEPVHNEPVHVEPVHNEPPPPPPAPSGGGGEHESQSKH